MAELTAGEIFEGVLNEERLRHRQIERELEAQRRELAEQVERLNRRLRQETAHRQQAELRLSLMIAQLPWGVVLEDADGRLNLANQQYCELFQLKIEPSKLVGTDLHAMEQNAAALFMNPGVYLSRLEEVRLGSEAALGDILELASGDIWRRDSIPIKTPEGGHGWLHLLQDVTTERRRESELQKAKTDAEDANRRTAAFLAAVSHEMKTPLSAVVGLTDVLGERLWGHEETSLVERVRTNAESLLHLIGDISDHLNLDEGRLRLVEGPLSPAEAVQTVKEQLSLEAERKGLELVTRVDEGLPQWVLGDEARVRQLLVGLAGNSLKFTTSGTITIRAYRPEGGSLDEICYELQDTGMGIPADQIDSVFERFFRVDSKAPGTGLGLSICRDLVHLMGGRVGIESEEGVGTRVFFILKQPALAQSEPSELDSKAPRYSVRPTSSSRVPSVLLVEDDPHNRALMARFMRNAGYLVHEVEVASQALQVWEEMAFDVLVTDISMPGIDGIELVRRLREHESQNNKKPRPTIVVTAHALPEYQERCRQAGVDVFLSKPIQGAVLCRALARVTQGVAKVLVVDDAPDSRLLLRLCLEQYSLPLEIFLVDSGAAAVEACREESFSILFLDAWMPEMDGGKALETIRSLPGYGQTPAIAITALTENSELEELGRAGFQLVLRKPFDRAEIHRAVREYLRAATVLTSRSMARVALESSPTLLQLEAVPFSGSPPGSGASSSPLTASVRSDVRELVPSYLESLCCQLSRLREPGQSVHFEEVARIGHDMKGTGGAYGFKEITGIGARLEAAGKGQDPTSVEAACNDLDGFLRKQLFGAALSSGELLSERNQGTS